ncbi:hypothetical protein [Nocardioides pakistanensis]
MIPATRGAFPLASIHDERLTEMAALAEGWHPGMARPDQDALRTARAFLGHLPLPVQARVETYPAKDGRVLAEWVERGLVLSLVIGADETITGRLYDTESEDRSEHAWSSAADAAGFLNDAAATRRTSVASPDPLAVPTGCAEADAPSTRFVGLFCDRGCGTTIEADVVADTTEQAYAGLRRMATGQGWDITPGADICPACHGACTAYAEYGYRCGLPAGHDPQQDHVNVRQSCDGQ